MEYHALSPDYTPIDHAYDGPNPVDPMDGYDPTAPYDGGNDGDGGGGDAPYNPTTPAYNPTDHVYDDPEYDPADPYAGDDSGDAPYNPTSPAYNPTDHVYDPADPTAGGDGDYYDDAEYVDGDEDGGKRRRHASDDDEDDEADAEDALLLEGVFSRPRRISGWVVGGGRGRRVVDAFGCDLLCGDRVNVREAHAG